MSTKKDLLILEDDRRIQMLLKDQLGDTFKIHTANRLYEAKQILSRLHIDLACLDIILPDGSGLEFCKEIKEEHKDIKVIILSKKISPMDRVNCFNCGADDYLPKPFFPEELTARIKRLLRTENELITSKHSRIALNPERGEAILSNMTVILPPTQFLVMEYLLLSEGFKDPEMILKYINTKRNRAMNRKALVVLISRMKARFERNIGMRVVKTRYSKGYYLAI